MYGFTGLGVGLTSLFSWTWYHHAQESHTAEGLFGLGLFIGMSALFTLKYASLNHKILKPKFFVNKLYRHNTLIRDFGTYDLTQLFIKQSIPNLHLTQMFNILINAGKLRLEDADRLNIYYELSEDIPLVFGYDSWKDNEITSKLSIEMLTVNAYNYVELQDKVKSVYEVYVEKNNVDYLDYYVDVLTELFIWSEMDITEDNFNEMINVYHLNDQYVSLHVFSNAFSLLKEREKEKQKTAMIENKLSEIDKEQLRLLDQIANDQMISKELSLEAQILNEQLKAIITEKALSTVEQEKVNQLNVIKRYFGKKGLIESNK